MKNEKKEAGIAARLFFLFLYSSPSGNRPLVAERLGRALLDGGQKKEGGG